MGKGKKIALGVGIAFGAFIALALIAAAVTPNSNSAPAVFQPQDIDVSNETPNPTPAGNSLNTPAEINQAVMVNDISYTLVESHTSSEILYEKADGRFMIITLTVLNKGDESKTIHSSSFKLLDSEARSFDSDSASVFLDNDIFLSQLNPGVSTTGRLAFDIPLTSGSYVLQVSSNELFSTDKKYIGIGSIQADFTNT